MKTTSILLIACLAFSVTSTGWFFDVSKTRVETKEDWDVVSIPCVGGSEDYEWEFEQIPSGWYARNDKVYVPKGKFDVSKYYGLKVRVFDKLFGSFLNKSIFLNVEDTDVNDCFDVDAEVDVKDEVQVQKIVKQRRRVKPYRPAKPTEEQIVTEVYSFPTQQEIEAYVRAGDIKWIRKIIVSVIKSKIVTCTEASEFLNNVLATIQAHISVLSSNSIALRKEIVLIREQIKFLQQQIKDLGGNVGNVKNLQARLASFRRQFQEYTERQGELRVRVQGGARNIAQYEEEILTLRRQIINPKQAAYDHAAGKVKGVDVEIDRLQKQLGQLRKQRRGYVAELNDADREIKQAQIRISTLSKLISKVRDDNSQLNASIESITLRLESLQTKIDDIVAKISQAQSYGVSVSEIQAKIDAKKKLIRQKSVELSEIDVLIIDLRKAHKNFERRVNRHYIGCFSDDNTGDNGSSNGGDHGNTGDDNTGSVDGGQDVNSNAFTNYLKGIFGSIFSPNIRTRFSGVGQVGVKSLTIFSPAWVKVFGLPYSGGYGNNMDIMEMQFSCATPEDSQDLDAFKGYITRITKNFIDVKDAHGDEYTVHLGGCTRIETITQQDIPEVGDSVYWKGKHRRNGSARQYNGHHVTCY